MVLVACDPFHLVVTNVNAQIHLSFMQVRHGPSDPAKQKRYFRRKERLIHVIIFRLFQLT